MEKKNSNNLRNFILINLVVSIVFGLVGGLSKLLHLSPTVGSVSLGISVVTWLVFLALLLVYIFKANKCKC